MSIRPWGFALLVSLAILPLGARGEEPDATVDEPPTATVEEEPMPTAGPDASAPLLHGTLELSLRDAIQMGLENNLDVQVERYSPMIAGFDASAAWGAYDPTLFAEAAYSDSKTPNSFAITGVNESIVRSTEASAACGGSATRHRVTGQLNGGRTTTNRKAEFSAPLHSAGDRRHQPVPAI